MKKLLTDIVDGLSYMFISGDEKDHDKIPFKEKVKAVLIWGSVIIFCYVMLSITLH